MEKLKLFIYAIVDWLFLGKGISRHINGFKLKFPARWARYFESDYENENVQFMKQHVKQGMTVVDVGAHIGLMSLIASQLCGARGKVIAIEPSPFTFNLLKRMIELNPGYAPVTPIQAAVSNKTSLMDFYVSADPASNSNSLVEKHHLKRNKVQVKCLTLDAVVNENRLNQVDLVKIDAEGSELDVLRGMNETLGRFKPQIILAIHPRLIRNNGQNPLDIFKLITRLGYEAYLSGTRINEKEYSELNDFFDIHLIHPRQ
ncbi:MAG TPA: FkbM family methyltransferase [Bacteroidia bacterium]|nr:FkbM family methyltransferase [Bacteroidia bacterium]